MTKSTETKRKIDPRICLLNIVNPNIEQNGHGQTRAGVLETVGDDEHSKKVLHVW